MCVIQIAFCHLSDFLLMFLCAVARPHLFSTSKGVFLSSPTAINASEPPAPSAGFSVYKKLPRVSPGEPSAHAVSALL